MLFPLSAAGDDGEMLKDSKQELDRLKKQLTDTGKKVDSLNQLETSLQKTISGYSERVNRNRKLIDKTERHLTEVRREVGNNNELLQNTTEQLQLKRESYINLLVDYYRRKKSQTDFDMWDFGSVMSQSRMMHYLTSISGRSTQEINKADDSVRLLIRHIDSLTKTDTDLKRLRRDKKAKINLDLTLKEKEETSLGKVRHQSSLMQERLETLSDAARRMEEIVAELEQAQARRRQEGPLTRYREGSFARSKGFLMPPIKGKIISAFGWKKDKITNLSSFSPGIDIKPSPGYSGMKACAPGRVVYVGQLRGYDNFVIIEHDDGFYTTYAGLGNITVELDELVSTGDALGSLAQSVAHFEIRRGREHLDPVIWLDLNEF
jgi:septal ring factor EnvC (AmiA/AmiB activator)